MLRRRRRQFPRHGEPASRRLRSGCRRDRTQRTRTSALSQPAGLVLGYRRKWEGRRDGPDRPRALPEMYVPLRTRCRAAPNSFLTSHEEVPVWVTARSEYVPVLTLFVAVALSACRVRGQASNPILALRGEGRTRTPRADLAAPIPFGAYRMPPVVGFLLPVVRSASACWRGQHARHR